MLGVLGAVAEFEANIREERQLEGIAKAKDVGVLKGREPSVDVEAVKALKVSGNGPAQIARELGIGRASAYRSLEST